MDPRLDLIDHPPRDPDPPRDPVLTAAVMERIRALAAPRPARGIPAWTWIGGVLALVLAAPWEVGGGAMPDLLDPGLAIEAVAVMALSGIVLVLLQRMPA